MMGMLAEVEAAAAAASVEAVEAIKWQQRQVKTKHNINTSNETKRRHRVYKI